MEPATAETVRAALQAAMADGVPAAQKELAFYGGSFTAIPAEQRRELLQAAGEFVKNGGAVRVSTRPDCLTAETAAELVRGGVKTVELGCQSMDDDVLRQSGRGHTAEDARKAVEAAKKAGLSVILQMMTGLPGDTLEKALQTAKSLAEMKPDGVRIYPTVIVRDTPLYDLWRQGSYREHTVEQAVEWCCRILDVFDGAGIPVIRLGLNPSDELSGGAAAAGAYHPAFGELVLARRFLEKERALLSGTEPGQVRLAVNPSCISQAAGNKRKNLQTLQDEYPLVQLKIIGLDTIPKGEIRILQD